MGANGTGGHYRHLHPYPPPKARGIMTTKQSFFLRIAPLLVMLLIAMAMPMGLFNSDPTRDDHRMVGKKTEMFEIPILDRPPPAMMSPKTWRGKVVVLNV